MNSHWVYVKDPTSRSDLWIYKSFSSISWVIFFKVIWDEIDLINRWEWNIPKTMKLYLNWKGTCTSACVRPILSRSYKILYAVGTLDIFLYISVVTQIKLLFFGNVEIFIRNLLFFTFYKRHCSRCLVFLIRPV